MRLRDRIIRLTDDTEHRAHVSTQDTASGEQRHPGGQLSPESHIMFLVDQRIRAIIRPPARDVALNEQFRWRNRTYVVSQLAYRRRGGRDHHVTLTLETPED